MCGTFGYELDLNKLNGEEKEQARRQIKRFQTYYDLIQSGDYCRLEAPSENSYFVVWEFAAQDRSEALVNLVVTHPRANPNPVHFRLKGLDSEARYVIQEQYYGSCHVPQDIMYISEEAQLAFGIVLCLEVFWCSQFTGPVALFRYGLYALLFIEIVIASYLFPTMATVAVAAARLGAKTGFVGKVGRDLFGQDLRNVLNENGNVSLETEDYTNLLSGKLVNLSEITLPAYSFLWLKQALQ